MAQRDHDQLVGSHRQTLETARRRNGLGARLLFELLNIVYGKLRSHSKFKVLELVARVPY